MKSPSAWTETDTVEAKRIWQDYQKTHDVTHLKGQAAGIDPESGKVWFGESALDAVQKMKAEGIDRPLFFIRVGYDFYLRKGVAGNRGPSHRRRCADHPHPDRRTEFEILYSIGAIQ